MIHFSVVTIESKLKKIRSGVVSEDDELPGVTTVNVLGCSLSVREWNDLKEGIDALLKEK